jgi:hypothetical protein
MAGPRFVNTVAKPPGAGIATNVVICQTFTRGQYHSPRARFFNLGGNHHEKGHTVIDLDVLLSCNRFILPMARFS